MIPVREFYVAFQHTTQITIQLLRNVSENSASIAVKERPWSVYSESNHVAPAFGSAPVHAERTICLDRSFGRDEHRCLIIPRMLVQFPRTVHSDVPESAHSCASPSSHPFQRLQFCLQLLNPFTMRRPRKSRNRGGAATCSENILRISIFQENLVCLNPKCRLKQYERGSGKCRRCHHSLGISYIEIYLPSSLEPITSQEAVTIRKEVGGLIRRLRSRREITQAGLAALTGIHRTYLSRAERGQVMPSIVALMQIARALEVDKILMRVRSSSN